MPAHFRNASEVSCVKRTVPCSGEAQVRETGGVEFHWHESRCVSRTIQILHLRHAPPRAASANRR
jgi:hypothetical protein